MIARIRIRHGQHHARRAERGVRDEALDAVEHVAAVHFLCARARAADVRTALRLRDRHGDALTAQNARAGGLLLRLRAVGEDRRQAERVGIVRDREAGVMLGQLLADAVARHGVESQSAVLLRHVQTKQAHFAPFFVQLHREFALFIIFFHDRIELTLGKFADHFDDILLLRRHVIIKNNISIHGCGPPWKTRSFF